MREGPSIRAFGFRQPLVVDEADVIIVGHTRYKAAVKLGLEEVPVHIAHGLTPARAKAYRIADNQTATLSTWDDDRLPLELAGLQALDFDLALTGFSADELDRLMAPPPAGLTDPDDVPDPPVEPTTRTGDLWLLDRHRLVCGDATDPAVLERLMGDTPADLLLTDPPYNVGYTGGTPTTRGTSARSRPSSGPAVHPGRTQRRPRPYHPAIVTRPTGRVPVRERESSR